MAVGGVLSLSLGIFTAVQIGKARFGRLNEFGVETFDSYWDMQKARFSGGFRAVMSPGLLFLGMILLFGAFSALTDEHLTSEQQNERIHRAYQRVQ